ncbi:MAG TPA: YcxB family protein [Candidatus Obscuribacter sp.]|nr:YcxB family protein [Candidatus Obscuribacter sp.]MBK9277163.1 YcxB family protein [Candidatus Obscuribacter sp.]HMW88890.1 YcxB family protein [Candidatus Obscuribacter sp.]HMX47825.1 YcxB family protein [Candidatus Obscuribacter sp.]HMY04350.1 YcxB family protein [Candidatus Obscuribacter sp.]
MSDIAFYVKYRPEEVNDGYWSVYKRLILPGQLLSVFFVSFLLAEGYAYSVTELGDYIFGAAGIDEGQLLLAVLIAGVGIPSIVTGLAALLIESRVRNSYESRPNFHFPIIYILGQNGLNITFASGQGTLDWSHLNACVETAYQFCLVAGPQDVFVLPKRCLTGDEEVKAVRHLIVSKVRTYLRHSGKDLPIKYEKAGIAGISIEGSGVEVGALGIITEGQSADQGELKGEDNSPCDRNLGSSGQSCAGGETLAAEPDPSLPPGLKTGVAVEVIYREGEVQGAEKIYFFRKRLPMLSLQYLAFLGWLLPSTFAVGFIWGKTDLVYELFQNYGWVFTFALPVYAMHAVYTYLLVLGRARLSEAMSEGRDGRSEGRERMPFVFELTEEGCGLRAAERYAVLAWWHFEEVWETKETFMLLFGRRGRAMYVIPKRAFPERVGLAYAHNLLSRKVRKLLVLE